MSNGYLVHYFSQRCHWLFLLPMQIQESRVLILRDQGKQQVGFHKFYNLKCLNFAFTELVHHMLSEVTTKLMKQSVVSCNMLFNKRLMRDINRSKLKIALRQDNFPSKPIPELPVKRHNCIKYNIKNSSTVCHNLHTGQMCPKQSINISSFSSLQ